jgi:hypothetical protein
MRQSLLLHYSASYITVSLYINPDYSADRIWHTRYHSASLTTLGLHLLQPRSLAKTVTPLNLLDLPLLSPLRLTLELHF